MWDIWRNLFSFRLSWDFCYIFCASLYLVIQKIVWEEHFLRVTSRILTGKIFCFGGFCCPGSSSDCSVWLWGHASLRLIESTDGGVFSFPWTTRLSWAVCAYFSGNFLIFKAFLNASSAFKWHPLHVLADPHSVGPILPPWTLCPVPAGVGWYPVQIVEIILSVTTVGQYQSSYNSTSFQRNCSNLPKKPC